MNALNDGDTVETYQAVQLADMPDTVLVVTTVGTPDGLTPMMKSIVENLDPNLFPEIRLLRAAFKENLEIIEQIAMGVSLLGMMAMLLAAVGLVGLVSHAVSERTKEIAIRIALGAKPGHVLSAILRQFVWAVAIGLLAGLSGTAALSQVLRRILFGVSNLDPLSYAGALSVLLAIATIAALLPARRARYMGIRTRLWMDGRALGSYRETSLESPKPTSGPERLPVSP